MKFCILAAGIGLHNNTISGLHKGLLPIQTIPMISHVISKLDPMQEIRTQQWKFQDSGTGAFGEGPDED